jgi:hypothetical protein
MSSVRFAQPLVTTLLAAVMAAGPAVTGHAQHADHHDLAPTHHAPTVADSTLVQAVREATARYKDVTNPAGPGGGYALAFGCVSGSDYGAMGLHYVNMGLIGDGEVDVRQPEIILYEPDGSGGIRITGADYVVIAADWDAKHAGPPMLMGQLFHLFESPNRFGLPPFYTLHVWAWKANPNGTFVNWNPDVSCDGF